MEQSERLVPRYPREIQDISTMALQTSDVLVLTAGETLSQGQADRIRGWMRGMLDDLGLENRVIVLDRGMKLEALRALPEIYEGLPPNGAGARSRHIGFSADGRPWVLVEAPWGMASAKVWIGIGFEVPELFPDEQRPCVKAMVDDNADFIVSSMPAIMPKRPREASHGEATDEAASGAVGSEQRGAPVSADCSGEESGETEDEGGARGAGGGSGEAGGGEAGGEAQALSGPQRFLLEWLGKEDVSQYGECRGADFDALERLGLVELLGTRDDPRLDYLGCRLTDAGRTRLAALKSE